MARVVSICDPEATDAYRPRAEVVRRMVNRAIETLERAIDSAPRHIGLREKLREILIDTGKRDHHDERSTSDRHPDLLQLNQNDGLYAAYRNS